MIALHRLLLLATALVGASYGFEEIIQDQLCGRDYITIELSRESYIYNVTAAMFAVYTADTTVCPNDKPIHIVNAINPDTRFTINATYCNFRYKAIIGRDGRDAVYTTNLHFYVQHFNPFTLKPDGDKYPFPLNCMVLPPPGTTTLGPQTTPTMGTSTSYAPPFTTSTAGPSTTSAPCQCCECVCKTSMPEELSSELVALLKEKKHG